MSQSKEFQNFDQTMRKLMSTPHSELKAKLEEEKAAKRQKRKAKKPSASGRASREKD